MKGSMDRTIEYGFTSTRPSFFHAYYKIKCGEVD
jgi:hypothetical protein